MNRQEREMAKNIEKELKLSLKSASKRNKWSFKDSVIFKAEKGFFFEAMIGYNKISKYVDVRLSFKPLALDDLFWEIFNLPENKKQPLSFRTFGVFTVCSFEIVKWQESFIYIEGHLEEYCNEIIVKVQKVIEEVLSKVNDLHTYMDFLKRSFIEHQSKYPGSVVNINLELILSFIVLGRIEESLAIINSRLESGDKGRYLNADGTGVYDSAKVYCKTILNEKFMI